MTKRIMSNQMVAHTWAQFASNLERQSEARTANGNMSFDGSTLFSYYTPIANFVLDKDGVPRCLMTQHSYSITTNGKHLGPARRAVNYRYYSVPCLGVRGGLHYEPRYSGSEEMHAINAASLREAYEGLKADASGTKRYIPDLERFHEAARNYEAYCEQFDIRPAVLSPLEDFSAALAIREAKLAKRNTPQAIAKREKEAAKRAAREAELERLARCTFAERLEAWQAGSSLQLPRQSMTGPLPAYLRVKGQTLETSQGATVPLDHAIKAFRFVKAIRERGIAWERNGHTVRVGHFQIDRIAANGDFNAGCHFIEWQEVERLAKALGIFEQAASNEALEPTTQHASSLDA